MSGQPWYKTALRWGQTNLVECDPKRYDNAWWRAHWRKTRVQGVIVNAGGIVAYYPSKFELHHRAEMLGELDLYGEIVKEAREEGLAVIARMDSNRVAEDFYEAHPDWICRDINGDPYRLADKYVTCIGSDYYTNYLPSVMEEIIERSQPDGFADNSWAGLPRKYICYCDSCKTQFRAYADADLPRKHDWSDGGYRNWIRWNFERRTSIWKLNNEITRKAGGEHCAWMGMISGETLYNSQRFIDLQGILRQTSIIMLDHQRRNAIDGFEQNTEAGKRLHEIAGWDKLIPESTPQYQLGAPVFRLSSMPQSEVRLWATAGFAGGIQPWWHHIGSCHEDRRQYQTAEPIFRWHEANQDILVDRELTPDVGVVWSQQNQDFFGKENAVEKTMAPYRGVVKALDRHAIPYVPLHADDIASAYERFKCMILPNIGALSDEQIGHIRSFVGKGGSVIATGDTSSCTLYGDERPDLALSELFGVRRTKGSVGGTSPINPDIEIWDRHTYLRLAPENRASMYGPKDETAPSKVEKRHAILAGLDGTDTLPFGGYLPIFEAAPGTHVLATYISDFPIFPPETSWMREPTSSIPAITVKSAPEGGKLIWLIADIDRCFARDANPEHAQIIANAVDHALRGRRKVKISGGHGVITAELYRQNDRTILHLNNRLLLSTVPGRQYDLVPIGPITVEVTTATAAGKVDLRVSGKTVVADHANGSLRFTVDSISDHEVAVIE
jgi:hypothetical protein